MLFSAILWIAKLFKQVVWKVERATKQTFQLASCGTEKDLFA